MSEVVAHLLFWSGLGSAPLGVVLLVSGIMTRNRLRRTLCVAAVPLAWAHFLWFFQSLAIGLADKTGDLDSPSWPVYMLTASLFSVALGTLASSYRRHSRER